MMILRPLTASIGSPSLSRRGAAPVPIRSGCCAPSRQDVIFSARLARNIAPIISAAALAALFILAGCGYHVAGRTDSLPQSIHVIAVPALENSTTSYRIEQRLTSATVHEFLAKTHYKVVSNPADGDAVLRGKVMSLEAVPLLFDTVTGRATTMLVTVKCEVTLTQTTTPKVLYHNNNFVFRSQYEVSTNVASFFEEQDPALDRVAHDFAQRLVAAVTENF